MTTKVTEKLVKDKITKIIKIYSKYNDIYTLCPMTFGYGESGHPDRLVLIDGVLIGIEAKRDKNNAHTRPELKAKPNEVMQKAQATRIIAAGGKWYCIHSENLHTLIAVLDFHSLVSRDKFEAKDKAQLSKLAEG